MEEVCGWFGCDISIHAPREGGDIILHIEQEAGALFQSTPPARGATSMDLTLARIEQFQSTPPARGATAAW